MWAPLVPAQHWTGTRSHVAATLFQTNFRTLLCQPFSSTPRLLSKPCSPIPMPYKNRPQRPVRQILNQDHVLNPLGPAIVSHSVVRNFNFNQCLVCDIRKRNPSPIVWFLQCPSFRQRLEQGGHFVSEFFVKKKMVPRSSLASFFLVQVSLSVQHTISSLRGCWICATAMFLSRNTTAPRNWSNWFQLFSYPS